LQGTASASPICGKYFLAIAPLFRGPIRLAGGGIAGFLSAGIGAR